MNGGYTDEKPTSPDQPTETTPGWAEREAAAQRERVQACAAEIAAALERHGCQIDPFIEITGRGLGQTGYRILPL